MTLSSICFTLVGRLPLIMRLVVLEEEAFILLSKGRAIESPYFGAVFLVLVVTMKKMRSGVLET